MTWLRLSVRPPLDALRRWVSRCVWLAWLLAFGAIEAIGDLRFAPWRTLSETAWDLEARHPNGKRWLEAFILGLAVHIRYRTTLSSSVMWADSNLEDFDEYVRGTGFRP